MLMSYGNIANLQLARGDKVSKKMKIQFKMFGTSMVNRVGCKSQCTHVVTPLHGRRSVQANTNFKHQFEVVW